MQTPKPSAADSKDATAKVKSAVASLAESWNRHDMAAFAAAFAENADFVNVIGMHWQGRQEIEAKHTVTHRTIFRNSALQIVEQSVRFLNPTVALAHVWTQLKGAESLRERVAPETRRTLMTCVLVKGADRWLITAAHNTDIVPVPFPVG
ncbi:MAG: SgcJ/EcaC family oxidoreductase [Candidatus Sulfotelmatobacter sp.]|jgi:uncharacterized protein (TIGR02246 family)